MLFQFLSFVSNILQRGLATPEIKARFAELGGTAGGEPPEQFAKYVLAQRQKWAQVATEAKIERE